MDYIERRYNYGSTYINVVFVFCDSIETFRSIDLSTTL